MSAFEESFVVEEPRWPPRVAVLTALVLYVTLPPRLTLGPVWLAPLMVLAILVPLSIVPPRRWHAQSQRLRFWGIALIAIVNFFNIASVALLVTGFFHPTRAAQLQTAGVLLRHGLQIWLTNIVVFGLWFWELDARGPDARAHASAAERLAYADFLFPQMQMEILSGRASAGAANAWRPAFFDYLYVAFTNATAFSPTDTMPLSCGAKLLMMVESFISLLTIAIIVSRAVGLIQ